MDKRLYNKCIKNGCSKQLAEMLASNQAPAQHGKAHNLQHQAEKNTKKLGKYEYESKLHKTRRKKPKREIPWWREGPIKPELMTATKKEKQNYIEKGILPPNRIKEFKEKLQEKRLKRKRDAKS